MNKNPDNFKYDIDLLKYINKLFCGDPERNIFGEYLRYLITEGNVSERTITIYIKDLFGTYQPERKFVRSAEYTFFTFINRGQIVFPSQIDREFIRNYISWLINNKIAKTSVNRRLSSVRSWYKFLLVEQILENSPLPVRTHERNSPRSSLSMKLDKRLPVFLTQPEVEKMIATPDTNRPEGKRDRAMLELLYASGLRVSELWQLDLESLNLGSREVRVIGKGAKERLVLMGVPAATAIQDYLSTGRQQLLNRRLNQAVFLNRQGRRLSIRGIQKILKRYALANGLEKNVHPHVLRHTFATHLLDGGADLRVVQELLGHADLSSTQIYTHVTKQQARKVYLTAHPMAREKDENEDPK
jgi:site-specific recombinase XerD